MKRLFANRPGWKRIGQKRFYGSCLDTPDFSGYITLLCLDEVRVPLWNREGLKPVCLVDSGYSWLQHFPLDEHYAVTTMFNEQGKIIQWYIDICLRTGVTENGIPWLDDLFLDIVVFPDGEVKLLDVAELENALNKDEISKSEYELALCESKKLMERIAQNNFGLLNLCEKHRLSLFENGDS